MKIVKYLVIILIGMILGACVTAAEAKEEVGPECWVHYFTFARGTYASCFHIGNGLVVTNAHAFPLIEGDTTIVVKFKDGPFAVGKIKAADQGLDLAIIEIDPPKKLQSVILAERNAEPWEDVYWVGNAGPPVNMEFVMQTGTLVGYRKNAIWTTATAIQGVSGSPLYNRKGIVIGVMSESFGGLTSAGAIPVEVLKAFLNKEAGSGKESIQATAPGGAVEGRSGLNEEGGHVGEVLRH